jgi:hypothetical protein
VTGAVVDLTLFSAWLNAAWKVTVVDADNFDLDTAVWQTTADNSGTVTPRGGQSWADAWLTLTNGSTSARISAGDEIRVAKTADPVSLGQSATFTNNSQNVTLTTAVTKKIEDVISGWTGATNITVSTSTTRKMGATAQTFTPAAAFTTGKMAYKAIAGGGTQDFSAYTHVSCWMRPTASTTWAAGNYYIALCSDTTGDVVVNQIDLPAYTVSANNMMNVVINYGGALGSNIQSVAIYATVDPGTRVLSLNNIFATTSTGLHLNSLIGKSGDVNYTIQSIDDTTIKIDSNSNSATGQGYSGTTETVTIYHDSTTITQTAAATALAPVKGGDAISGVIHYSGGWNTTNTTRDGYTVITKTLVGNGSVLSMYGYNKWTYWKVFRHSNQNSSSGTSVEQQFENCIFGGGGTFLASLTYEKVYYKNCKFLNCSSAINLGASGIIEDCEFRNMTGSGVNTINGLIFINCTFTNNSTSSIAPNNPSPFYIPGGILRNCLLSDSTEYSANGQIVGITWSYNNDQTAGNHWGWTFGGTINWQTTTKQGSDVGSWKVTLTSTNRTSLVPMRIRLGEIGCIASSTVTVTVWVKKDHATNIQAKLFVEDAKYNLTGVSATSDTKTDDTSWEQLSISFTPTVAGFVPIWVDVWCTSTTNAIAYIGSMTVTQ